MLIKRPADIRPSEITDRSDYLTRRRFIRNAVNAGVLGTIGGGVMLAGPSASIPPEKS